MSGEGVGSGDRVMKKLLLLLAFAAGCSHFPLRQEIATPDQTLTVDQFSKSRSFVLVQGSWALWNGTSTRWVFDADGPCFGETTASQDGKTVASTAVELPPETFREAQKRVLESKLLTLVRGEQNFIFEGGGSLAIEAQGRKHEITFGSPPRSCQPLLDFLRTLPDRGKVTSTAGTLP